MNFFRTATFILSGSLLVFPLASCSSSVPTTQLDGGVSPTTDAIVTGLASNLGASAGEKEVKDLDTYLAGPIRSKQTLEVTARKLKTEYSQDPAVMAQAQSRYQKATGILNSLRLSVRADLASGSKESSANTQTLTKNFNDEVLNYVNYYDQVSGSQTRSFGLLGGVAILKNLFNAWNTYQTSKQNAILSGVDARLTAKDWSQIS